MAITVGSISRMAATLVLSLLALSHLALVSAEIQQYEVLNANSIDKLVGTWSTGTGRVVTGIVSEAESCEYPFHNNYTKRADEPSGLRTDPHRTFSIRPVELSSHPWLQAWPIAFLPMAFGNRRSTERFPTVSSPFMSVFLSLHAKPSLADYRQHGIRDACRTNWPGNTVATPCTQMAPWCSIPSDERDVSSLPAVAREATAPKRHTRCKLFIRSVRTRSCMGLTFLHCHSQKARRYTQLLIPGSLNWDLLVNRP